MESDNNRVGIGTTAPGDILTIVDTTLPTLGIFYSDADGAVSDGDDLAKIEFGIYDSDAGRFGAGVRILGEAAGTIGGGADDFPMNLHIQVLDDGTAESGFATAIMVQQDGKVGIGETVPERMLHVHNPDGSAVDVIKLEQSDIDEPFIDFTGTSAADQTRSLSTDTSVGALTGHILVSVNGTDRWISFYAKN